MARDKSSNLQRNSNGLDLNWGQFTYHHRTSYTTYEVDHRLLFNYTIQSRLRELGVSLVWAFVRDVKPDLRRVSGKAGELMSIRCTFWAALRQSTMTLPQNLRPSENLKRSLM